jgi:hypothetical protein
VLRKVFGDNCRKSFITCTVLQISNQVKEDETSGACSRHGREEEWIQDFGGKARRKEATRKT